jgi:hypothetical protein
MCARLRISLDNKTACTLTEIREVKCMSRRCNLVISRYPREPCITSRHGQTIDRLSRDSTALHSLLYSTVVPSFVSYNSIASSIKAKKILLGAPQIMGSMITYQGYTPCHPGFSLCQPDSLSTNSQHHTNSRN